MENITLFITYSNDIETAIKTKAAQIKIYTCDYIHVKANTVLVSVDILSNENNPTTKATESMTTYATDKNSNLSHNNIQKPPTPSTSKLFPHVIPYEPRFYLKNIEPDKQDFCERPELPQPNNDRNVFTVNVNIFYKIKWNIQYNKEMDIFDLYGSL